MIAAGSISASRLNGTCARLFPAHLLFFQVALGLVALHSATPRPMLHCDLKAVSVCVGGGFWEAGFRCVYVGTSKQLSISDPFPPPSSHLQANVLISGLDEDAASGAVRRVEVKVADFGLSRVRGSSKASGGGGGGAGTYTHMAPEVIDDEYAAEFGVHFGASPASDVFSLAVVMWELLTGEEPHANLNSPASIISFVVVKRKRLALPVLAGAAAGLGGLIGVCWSASPKERPAARDVADRLGEMLGRLEAEVRVVSITSVNLIEHHNRASDNLTEPRSVSCPRLPVRRRRLEQTLGRRDAGPARGRGAGPKYLM